MGPFYADDAVTIWHGNALDLPLDDESVDLVVCSPPYWSLRSYRDSGEHYDGQIGSEETPGEFIDALAAATREMARVLKPSGSIFLNLGDKYADKSLMLLPERYRIRCTDDLGLIARAVIVWAKPNGLPESVRDRVRRSHEDWVHMTKEPRYYSGIDEIREPHSEWTQKAAEGRWVRRSTVRAEDGSGSSGTTNQVGTNQADGINPLGKLPGSVWTIPTQPLRVPPELGIQHFAAFPMEWPRRLIRGWSPAGVCVECGEGRRPVRDGAWRYQSPRNEHAAKALRRARDVGLMASDIADTYGTKAYDHGREQSSQRGAEFTAKAQDLAEILGGRLYAFQLQSLVKREATGYACACPTPTAPTRPAVILDPFGGTGTTGVVAKALGRHAHLVDLSRDYCRLAQWRVNDPKELAKAGQVTAARKAKVTRMRPKPAPHVQDSLLDDPAA